MLNCCLCALLSTEGHGHQAPGSRREPAWTAAQEEAGPAAKWAELGPTQGSPGRPQPPAPAAEPPTPAPLGPGEQPPAGTPAEPEEEDTEETEGGECVCDCTVQVCVSTCTV